MSSDEALQSIDATSTIAWHCRVIPIHQASGQGLSLGLHRRVPARRLSLCVTRETRATDVMKFISNFEDDTILFDVIGFLRAGVEQDLHRIDLAISRQSSAPQQATK